MFPQFWFTVAERMWDVMVADKSLPDIDNPICLNSVVHDLIMQTMGEQGHLVPTSCAISFLV